MVVFVSKGAQGVWATIVGIVGKDWEVCCVVNTDLKVVERLQKIVVVLKEGRGVFQVETAGMADGGAEGFAKKDTGWQRRGYPVGIDRNAADAGYWQMWAWMSGMRQIFGAGLEVVVAVAGDAVEDMDGELLVYQRGESAVKERVE